MLTATPLYAGLLALLFFALSARVILYRRGNRIAYGDNDTPRFTAMIRAQGNFVEYAPFGLLLIAIAELNSAPIALVHLSGLLLLSGRMLHGLGMTFAPKQLQYRSLGMMLTATSLLASAFMCLWTAL